MSDARAESIKARLLNGAQARGEDFNLSVRCRSKDRVLENAPTFIHAMLKLQLEMR